MTDQIERARSLVGTGSNPDGRPDTDFYATPAWATKALIEKEFNEDKPYSTVLEPACGDGAISKVLSEEGFLVHSYDLYDHGYGVSGVDFLEAIWEHTYFDTIITNPPYRLAEEFLKKSLELTKPTNGRVALLLKLQFLEGQKRKKILEDSPLKVVYIFSKRLTFTRNNQPIGNSGMMAFAWYVWDWEEYDEPIIRWL